MRRYAVTLAHDFFRFKGREIKVSDYRRVLQGICLHIHRHLAGGQEGRGLDLLLVAADSSRLYGVRGGGGSLFLFHEGEAKAVLAPGKAGGAPLGVPGGERVETGGASLQPGDMVVLSDPSASAVMGARDITLILRRASDPAKAALFLSAIAERKGAESPFTALIWEVPNLQGAAMLTGEAPAEAEAPEEASPAGSGDETLKGEAEVSHADLAKRQWLSKWRKRKE